MDDFRSHASPYLDSGTAGFAHFAESSTEEVGGKLITGYAGKRLSALIFI